MTRLRFGGKCCKFTVESTVIFLNTIISQSCERMWSGTFLWPTAYILFTQSEINMIMMTRLLQALDFSKEHKRSNRSIALSFDNSYGMLRSLCQQSSVHWCRLFFCHCSGTAVQASATGVSPEELRDNEWRLSLSLSEKLSR